MEWICLVPYMHSEVFNQAYIYSYMEKELSTHDNWNWDVFTRNKDPHQFLADLLTFIPSFTTPATAHKRDHDVNAGGSGRGHDGHDGHVRDDVEGRCDGSDGLSGHDAMTRVRKGKAVGFKLFPEHWTPSTLESMQQLMVDKRIKKVILRRDNLLQLYASKLRADKTGDYLGKSLDGVGITIDPEAFQRFVDHYECVYRYYDRYLFDQSVFRMTYEEMIRDMKSDDDNNINSNDTHTSDESAGASNSDRASESASGGVEGSVAIDEGAEGSIDTGGKKMKRLLAFLGVDSTQTPQPLKVTIKQSSDEVGHDIANYEQIKFAFRHTRVAKYF